MSNARDKANIPALNFSSTGIDDNATSTAITIDSSENVGIGATTIDNTASGRTVLQLENSSNNLLNFYVNGSRAGYLYSSLSTTNLFSVPSVPLTFGTSNSERMRIDSSGNVGIGTSSPDSILDLTSTPNNNFIHFNATTGGSNGDIIGGFEVVNTGGTIGKLTVHRESTSSSGYMAFQTATTEKMRIDNSGNVLVGKTSTSGNVAGHRLSPDGRLLSTVSGNYAAQFNRLSNDGDIVQFNQAGDKVGAVSSLGFGGCRFNGGGTVTATGIEFSGSSLNPARGYASSDNTVDLGTSGDRFDDIYATNPTIQTSDANEKQSIQSLTTAEMNVAKRLSPLFKTFKWNSAVEEKGDSARTHTGIIAQDVQQAFADEGLDASNYALFISTTWWEEEVQIKNGRDEIVSDVIKYFNQVEAPSNAIQKNRLGIRFPELMAFIQAYNDQRFTELEARITALETQP